MSEPKEPLWITYEQAIAIDPEIFDPHSGQGVMVQERTVEEAL